MIYQENHRYHWTASEPIKEGPRNWNNGGVRLTIHTVLNNYSILAFNSYFNKVFEACFKLFQLVFERFPLFRWIVKIVLLAQNDELCYFGNYIPQCCLWNKSQKYLKSLFIFWNRNLSRNGLMDKEDKDQKQNFFLS